MHIWPNYKWRCEWPATVCADTQTSGFSRLHICSSWSCVNVANTQKHTFIPLSSVPRHSHNKAGEKMRWKMCRLFSVLSFPLWSLSSFLCEEEEEKKKCPPRSQIRTEPMSYRVAENSSTGSNFACCVFVGIGSLYSVVNEWVLSIDVFLTHSRRTLTFLSTGISC